MTFDAWPYHPLAPPTGGPAMHHLYRVHCPLRHDAIEDEGVFSPYTHDDVHASSPKAAAEDWVELHFADLDYTSCVEGLVVTGPDGAVTTWDVEVRSVPVFSASKARGEAR